MEPIELHVALQRHEIAGGWLETENPGALARRQNCEAAYVSANIDNDATFEKLHRLYTIHEQLENDVPIIGTASDLKPSAVAKVTNVIRS